MTSAPSPSGTHYLVVPESNCGPIRAATYRPASPDVASVATLNTKLFLGYPNTRCPPHPGVGGDVFGVDKAWGSLCALISMENGKDLALGPALPARATAVG